VHFHVERPFINKQDIKLLDEKQHSIQRERAILPSNGRRLEDKCLGNTGDKRCALNKIQLQFPDELKSNLSGLKMSKNLFGTI
jgi:hypothetical protein